MAAIPSLEADPCGRLSRLLAIRDQLITGGGVAETELEQGNGTRRRVKYSAANLDALNREISAAQAACNAASGNKRPTRFAIGGRLS